MSWVKNSAKQNRKGKAFIEEKKKKGGWEGSGGGGEKEKQQPDSKPVEVKIWIGWEPVYLECGMTEV